MKLKKQLFSVLLSIVFMFGVFTPSISSYAVSLSDINQYFSVQDKFYQILKRVTDISTTQEHQTNILNRMYDILVNGGYSGSRTGQGLQSSGDVTINSDGDVLLSVDLQNAIRQSAQTEIENSGYRYIYSQGAAYYLSEFSNSDKYHAFLNILSANDGKIIQHYGSSPYIIVYDDAVCGIYSSLGSDGYYSFYLYDSNWQRVSYGDKYEYNSTSKEFEFVERTNSYSSSGSMYALSDSSMSTSKVYSLVNQNKTQFIMYMSFSDMQAGSEGLQSYYVGNDFSTSTVSTVQTLTDSMLNSSISYSDISNYVNNYYVTNQTYPSSQDTYNYINNYTGSGGGSGGSGDDNSGGSGSNIWDFLGSIGEFLGSLISALGDVLSGILSVLTDVIGLFIGENGLPNVIGSLINYFLPFLPDWVPTLIGFSVVLALIIGVIKLIRG